MGIDSGCFSSNFVTGIQGNIYTYSTEPGVQDATVVGTQVGNDFGFKPLAEGPGMIIDETTNPGSITFTSTAAQTDLQIAYDNGNTIITIPNRDVIINGPAGFSNNTDVGEIMMPQTQIINRFTECAGPFNDQDIVFTWPRANPVIPVDAITYIEIVFIVSDINTKRSFISKLDIKFDPTDLIRVYFNFTRNMSDNTGGRIRGNVSGNTIEFILDEGNAIIPSSYNVCYYATTITFPR